MKNLHDIDFYLITYPSISGNDNLSDVKNAVDAGCRFVQYREKNKTTREMIKEAESLKNLCGDKAFFIIDNYVDVAFTIGADGVHIGQDDIPVQTAKKILGEDRIIGLTVHNVEEAVEAEKLGVDYIGLAPIFATDTKEDSGVPCGIEMVQRVRKSVGLPIVAVGGINMENVANVIRAGANGIVAVSSVLEANNVYDNVKDFIEIIREAKNR